MNIQYDRILNNFKEPHSFYSQSGMTLVISTVFLLILAIIGLSAMNVSNMELKMSGNSQDSYRAFSQAESVRVTAEAKVIDIAKQMRNNPSKFPDSAGFYNATQNEKPNPGVDFASFWATASNYTAEGYVVEYLGQEDVTLNEDRGKADEETMNIFRISVIGKGRDGATTALQSIYMQKAN